MKKLILALSLITLTPTHAMAGDTLFGAVGDAAMKARNALRTAIPTKVSALEADGGNFRYYEWVAPNNPNVTCFMVAGTQKGGAGCYPTSSKK